MPLPVRRPIAVLLMAAASLAVGAPASASSETAQQYRFWSYWWGTDGQWTYAPAAASHAVADGDVEGWRFAVSGTGRAEPPREAASFDALCGHVPRPDGSVRVALVVDYGDSADAPDGETPPARVDRQCVVVPETSATGVAVLAGYSTLRQRDGLICGIGGYPQRECAPRADAAPSAPAGPTAWDSELPGLAGMALVLGLGGAAAHRWRRPAVAADQDERGHA